MNSPQGTQFNTAATKGHTRGLPGGAGVQTPPANEGDVGSITGW